LDAIYRRGWPEPEQLRNPWAESFAHANHPPLRLYLGRFAPQTEEIYKSNTQYPTLNIQG